MNLKIFRILLIASFAVSVAGLAITFGFQDLVPKEVRIADEKALEGIAPGMALVAGASAIALLIASVVGYIGLYFLKAWSRKLNIILTACSFLLLPITGYQVTSGWALMFEDIGLVLWGAVLAMSYLSPLKEQFSARPANSSSPTDASRL